MSLYRKPKLTSSDLYRLYLVMELLRATGEKEFPMQLASVFFYVASHDGCQQEDVQLATGLSRSSVSRNVSWLSAHHRLEHRDGLKVLRRERDPNDFRRWKLFLTPKGHQWVNLIEQHLDGDLKKLSHAISSQTNRNYEEDL